MIESKDFYNNIIVRFLMNEASKEDIGHLENWISMDSDNKKYFEQIRDMWNSIELEKELDSKMIENDLRRILEQTEQKEKSNEIGRSNTRVLHYNWILKVAAVFILGFAVSWFVFEGMNSIDNGQVAYNIIETPSGSNTTINLPDGSKIWLNADSRLRYPMKFSKDKREVFLDGEAFFEVAKDKSRQFLVKTSDITVKVFGTRFNVKSYPDENTVETTLVEGSISIINNSTNSKVAGKEIKMKANERIVLYKEQENITPNEIPQRKIENLPVRKAKLVLSKRIDTDRFTSWKDGQLIIKGEPMIKLAVKLERRYNVKIHFEDEEIKQYKFTGTIKNETIEQVMEAIKLASSVDYKIEEREIWIRKI